MNTTSVHASPSTENPIASKKPDAKLHKRPEDDVPADAAAAAASDQDILLAQAAPAGAADGAASAGDSASAGGAAPSAAAEGSAGAGAGAPVVAAAAGGGAGIGIGALALGAGAVGLAAAGGHGGGGSGSASAVSSTQIHNFGEYMSVIGSGGSMAASTATAAIGPGPTSVVDISGGFSRASLPHTLSDLRPITYNVTGASVASINDGGIVVDLQGNPDAHVNAHSNAASGASNLMWMQNFAVRDQAGQGASVATASASADGAHSDAEIGIQHVSMALAGAGGLD